MTHYRIVQPDGATTPHEGEVSLKEMQAAVGGYVEELNPRYLLSEFAQDAYASGVRFFVHEDGTLMGLPPNPTATALVGSPQMLVGNLLMVGVLEGGPLED